MSYHYTIPFPAETIAGQGFAIKAEPTFDTLDQRRYAARDFLSSSPRSAFSALLLHGLVNKERIWTSSFELPSWLVPTVYPLWRTQIKHYFFRWLPHSVTGTLAEWMGIDIFSPLHECATGDCPFHRLKFPGSRAKVENRVIDAAIKTATAEAGKPVHLVSYAAGALFTETVLLSRLLSDKRLPKDTHVTLSIIGRWAPIAALIAKDEATFKEGLAAGYNEEYHVGTTAAIRAMGRVFNDLLQTGKVSLRFYADAKELQTEVQSDRVARADVVMLMDPGLESFDVIPALCGTLDLAKHVLAGTGALVTGHALKTHGIFAPNINTYRFDDGTLEKILACVEKVPVYPAAEE